MNQKDNGLLMAIYNYDLPEKIQVCTMIKDWNHKGNYVEIVSQLVGEWLE